MVLEGVRFQHNETALLDQIIGIDRNFQSRLPLLHEIAIRLTLGFISALEYISCHANHVNEAISAGATREEIIEATVTGIDYGGGASYVLVRDHLLEILDTFEMASG